MEKSFTQTLIINTSPDKLYQAITTEKGLASWWTTQVEIYPEVGGTATFNFGKDEYVVMKIAKLVQNREMTWKCVEQNFKTKGTEKTDEWVGTTVGFSIMENKDKTTTLTFTHNGLTQDLYCYDECEKGWKYFLGSLKSYLEKGKGKPFKSKER